MGISIDKLMKFFQKLSTNTNETFVDVVASEVATTNDLKLIDIDYELNSVSGQVLA